MEDFAESYSKFARKHGWSAPEQKKRVAAGFGVELEDEQEEEEWNFQMSALDDALYEYAKRLDAGVQPYAQFTQRTKENMKIYFGDVAKDNSAPEDSQQHEREHSNPRETN